MIRGLAGKRTSGAGTRTGRSLAIKFSSEEAKTMEQLLQIADTALYASKAAGRDRITLGVPELDPPLPAPAAAASEARNGGAGRPPHKRPSLHEAADEEDPAPSGVQIR